MLLPISRNLLSYSIYMAQARRTKRSQTRRTKRSQTRLTIRSRGGMDNIGDSINDHLRSLFPEFDAPLPFKITKKFEEENSETIKSYRIELNVCKEKEKHDEHYKPLITITVKDRRMHIDRLTSCTTVSRPGCIVSESNTTCKPVSILGKEIIKRYIDLAKLLKLHSITLDDKSYIYFPRSSYGKGECAIRLDIFTILKTGQSWYEKEFKFISSTSEAERVQNNEVRNMPFGEFVQRLIEKERQGAEKWIVNRPYLNNNNIQKKRANVTKSELRKLMVVFPEIKETTPVHEAVEQMVSSIISTGENACKSVQFRILKKVIDTCTVTNDPLIHYNENNLMLTL